MKKLALLSMTLLFIGTGSLTLAQTTMATADQPHPRIKEIHTRMRDQMLRIHQGVKTGKLTQEQAQTLMTSLKAVREQMQADFTTNGNKELTDSQVAELNQMLDANSKIIYGEKHDTGSTVPAGGSSSTENSAMGSPGAAASH